MNFISWQVVFLLFLAIAVGGCGSGAVMKNDLAISDKESEAKIFTSATPIKNTSTTIATSDYKELSSEGKAKHNLQKIIDYCKNKYTHLQEENFYFQEKNQVEYGKHNHQFAIKIQTNTPSEEHLPYYCFGLLSENGHIYFNKLFIFNQRDGSIFKVVDIDEFNPYLRSNDKKIERELYFDFEQVSKYKIKNPSERNQNHDKIIKYWTNNSFNYLPGCNAYTISFSKIGMTARNEIIDVFSSHFILDSLGNTVFKTPELRINPGTVSMSKDNTFCVIEFRNPEGSGFWNGRIMEDGLLIYDMLKNKEIHKYVLSEQDYIEGKSWEGGRFDNNSNLVFYSNIYPFSQYLANEITLIDLKTKTIYRKLFTKKEWEDLSLIYYKEYNTWRKVLSLFSFHVEKIKP